MDKRNYSINICHYFCVNSASIELGLYEKTIGECVQILHKYEKGDTAVKLQTLQYGFQWMGLRGLMENNIPLALKYLSRSDQIGKEIGAPLIDIAVKSLKCSIFKTDLYWPNELE